MGIVETVLGALFALTIGPLSAVLGWGILSRGAGILRATVSGGGASGLTTVTGTVRSQEATLTAPISGEECVLYAIAEDTYRYKRSTIRIKGWKGAGGTTVFVPFVLDGEGGTIRVDPRREGETEIPTSRDRADTRSWTDPFELPMVHQSTHEAGEPLPARLAAAIEDDRRLDPPGDRRKRYREWALRPGDGVSIAGTIEVHPDSESRVTDRVVRKSL